MSVSNGQIANQTTFNNAFVSRTVDTNTVGKIDLNNSAAVSGTQVTNVQRELNGEASFTGRTLNGAKDELPSWTSNDVGVSTDNLKSRVDALSAKFNELTGHNHDGTPGNGVIITTGSGAVKVDLVDYVSTVLPTGTGGMIDGVTLVNGMKVLFTNLISGFNYVHSVTGVGVSLVWTAENVFAGIATPTDGDEVNVLQGTIFGEERARFDGTEWRVPEKFRLFNGLDYHETSGIITATLTDATTANIFTVAYLGSENIKLSYSMNRGSAWLIGELLIKTDGTTVTVTELAGSLLDCQVEIFGDISGSDLRLRYTTASTGSDATMKYFTTRWSDGAGGPAGLPSYSVGTSLVAAAGSDTQIQYNSGGLLGADADFTWDSTNNVMSLAGLEIHGKQSATLVNNTLSPTAVVSMDQTNYRMCVFDYVLSRNGAFRGGSLTLVNDGTGVSIFYNDGDAPSAPTGIDFTADLSGGNMRLLYTATNTGFNATMKYSMRRMG